MALRSYTNKIHMLSIRQIRSFSSVKINDQFKVCSQCIAPFECLYHKRCKYPDDDNVLDDITLHTAQNNFPPTLSKYETDYDFGVNE